MGFKWEKELRKGARALSALEKVPSPEGSAAGLVLTRSPFPCTGYLVYLFLKKRSEQRFSIGLVNNFLKVYASIFDFLQRYATNFVEKRFFYLLVLSVQEALC
jgi:hypothetical protein